MLTKEFDFVLQDTLIYSHEGKAGIQAKRLLLRAPTTRLLSISSQISSIVMCAFMAAQNNYKTSKKDEKTENETSKVDGESLFMMISGNIEPEKMEKFVPLFSELLLSKDICLIDGKELLTSDLLENLDSRETVRLMGDYIANFLLPSIMNKSKKKI